MSLNVIPLIINSGRIYGIADNCLTQSSLSPSAQQVRLNVMKEAPVKDLSMALKTCFWRLRQKAVDYLPLRPS